jgi:hypothetical protein
MPGIPVLSQGSGLTLPTPHNIRGGNDMDGIRDLVQSLASSTWRTFILGTEQMTKAVTLPITGVLANLGEPFKSVASGAEDQIDNAFQATIGVGDNVQRETVDLMFDLFTLKPPRDSLKASMS